MQTLREIIKAGEIPELMRETKLYRNRFQFQTNFTFTIRQVKDTGEWQCNCAEFSASRQLLRKDKTCSHLKSLAPILALFAELAFFIPPKMYRGGFSQAVFQSKTFQDYIKHLPCGYIGSKARTKLRDATVESLLRKAGLGVEGIVDWLTSRDGRYLMDDVTSKTSLADFEERARDYTATAMEDVTVWNHPDYIDACSESHLKHLIWPERYDALGEKRR